MSTPVYLMSPPRRDWTIRGKSNKNSQRAAAPNPWRAREEWSQLADAIVAAGGEVLVIPPHPTQNLTGMPYVAEAGEYFRDREGRQSFILPTMKSEHRREEASWIGGFMAGLGFRTLRVPMVWEAQGDAIRATEGSKIIHTFGSGRFGRTGIRAYSAVAHLLSEKHIQIHFHADPWFHGNTFLNVYQAPAMPPRLNEDTNRIREAVLVCPQALLPGELNRLEAFLPHASFALINARESAGYDTNSLQVNDTVIAPTTVSETAQEVFRSLGLRLERLDLGELFAKGGGAPVCLTNRLWGLDAESLPDRVKWSKNAAIEDHTDV
ncbi:hypothetical protein FRD01_13500 [Microvenator marinus]|jgi:N-dimethylarginine dimethylaminohydrolase|uniref:Amidinotransferase n=1 Tax=Microvenator marinus TaxID=2600177 RepID=A0A5B8XRF9_9DELT|nr:hypothetical protein [Microvenator marinus]QED28230.1 hypothetical protein FRD01_13500 [Microvenator marinus]